MQYDMSQFIADASASAPRPFDIYVLPGFMMYYAWYSRKRGVPRAAARMLFGAGLWMAMRNLGKYREMVANVKLIKGEEPTAAALPPEPANVIPFRTPGEESHQWLQSELTPAQKAQAAQMGITENDMLQLVNAGPVRLK